MIKPNLLINLKRALQLRTCLDIEEVKKKISENVIYNKDTVEYSLLIDVLLYVSLNIKNIEKDKYIFNRAELVQVNRKVQYYNTNFLTILEPDRDEYSFSLRHLLWEEYGTTWGILRIIDNTTKD